MKDSIFIDPMSDGGFKLFFGKDGKSEEFLMDFLNELFQDDPYFSNITHLTYKNSEVSKDDILGKEIRYDIHCETSTGHRFIVEMQRRIHENFVDRTLYYISRSITEQVRRRYHFLPVVGVFVMEGAVNGMKAAPVLDFQMRDRNDPKESIDKIRMIYIQLRHFRLKEEECNTRRERWLYILKHLYTMDHMPFAETKDRIFERLDTYARMANLSHQEREEYDRMLKFQRDYDSDMHYSKLEGMKEGREEERWTIARNMMNMGMDASTISKVTGLSVQELSEIVSSE